MSLFGAPVAPPAALPSPNADYVGRFAMAIDLVMRAQTRLIQEVDTASRAPEILKDASWQERSQEAAQQLAEAGAELRIKPVPDSLAVVDGMLAEAQREGQIASQTHVSSVAAGNLAAMVSTLQHLDRMAELIEQAYAVIRR